MIIVILDPQINKKQLLMLQKHLVIKEKILVLLMEHLVNKELLQPSFKPLANQKQNLVN